MNEELQVHRNSNHSDSKKRKNVIRQTGAVYTPNAVAEALAAYALQKVATTNPNILEPSVGDGAFLGALLKCNPASWISAVDIDESVINQISEKFGELAVNPINLHACDYLKYSEENDDKKFDLVIGNPPFIRKHNFSSQFKLHLLELSNRTGYDGKFLKNAWAAFVVASTQHLTKQGVLAFIVPYELLTVNYGMNLQKEIFSKFQRVDLFVPDEKAFKGIDQDAVIFVAQRETNEEHGIHMHRVTNLDDLTPSITRKISTDRHADWALSQKSILLSDEAVELIADLRAKCKTIGDYCTSRPGIVTAANEFFILPESEVINLGLERWANPILKRGIYLSQYPVFTQQNFDELVSRDEPAFFLHIRGSESETFSPELKVYLEQGRQAEIHNRYKCRNRDNWYEVPLVSAPEAFFFKRSHSYPRICINEADVLVTDTAYCVTCKDGFHASDLCLSFYTSMTLLFSEIDGRFYGGGVLELTPTEFRGLPILYQKISKKEFGQFVNRHADSFDIKDLLDFGDQVLANKLSLSKHQINLLRESWELLRSHRLRHSGRKFKDMD